MMIGATVSALGVGFALGLKHALDADHLAAVAVMVGEKRRALAGASSVGLAWGLGHAAALAGVSLAVVLMGLRVPEGLSIWMEFLVGAILALLGGRMIWRCRRGAVLHVHTHQHGEAHHLHPHVHPEGVNPDHASHHELPAPARRLAEASGTGRAPFLVGIVHGMAGSAALSVLILTTIQGTAARLGYVALFGLGSILGMALMSALVGLPFTSARWSGARPLWALRIAAGTLSLAMGLFLMAGPALDAGL